MKVRCNKSDSTELCKKCPHNGVHDEVMPPPGMKINHSIAAKCSEGGHCRCIVAK